MLRQKLATGVVTVLVLPNLAKAGYCPPGAAWANGGIKELCMKVLVKVTDAIIWVFVNQ